MFDDEVTALRALNHIAAWTCGVLFAMTCMGGAGLALMGEVGATASAAKVRAGDRSEKVPQPVRSLEGISPAPAGRLAALAQVPKVASISNAEARPNAEQAALAVGHVFRDTTRSAEACLHCPEMVIVPRGRFVLGAGPGETWRDDWQARSEGPPVEIAVPQPFAVGRFAVSFDEWEACTAARKCAHRPNDNGWGRGDRPVINVSFDEAQIYVDWLVQVTGKPYRLLSEAEREYVTRAGTNTAFWFGDRPLAKRANYLWDRTMPVGSLAANPWGLFHVHGNVSEWTSDCWNASHARRPRDLSARSGGDCQRRVIKGGAWFNRPHMLRAAARAGLPATGRYRTVGLRVVRALVDGR